MIREVAARPEFELVGGLAYSDEKNGVDLIEVFPHDVAALTTWMNANG